MRLEAAVGGASWISLLSSSSVLCSVAFGHDLSQRADGLVARQVVGPALRLGEGEGEGVGGVLHKRQELNADDKNNPTRTADVFNAPNWPTVSVPAGFTLAGGVEITPLPEMATKMASGSMALAAALAAPTNADPARWNADADMKCSRAVEEFKGRATNPSGMTACYNIPFLNVEKGTFEAELRIYSTSPPFGEFEGVPPENMMVTLSYKSASLSASDGSLPVKLRRVKRQESGMLVREVSVRKYIGEFNPGVIRPGMTE